MTERVSCRHCTVVIVYVACNRHGPGRVGEDCYHTFEFLYLGSDVGEKTGEKI